MLLFIPYSNIVHHLIRIKLKCISTTTILTFFEISELKTGWWIYCTWMRIFCIESDSAVIQSHYYCKGNGEAMEPYSLFNDGWMLFSCLPKSTIVAGLGFSITAQHRKIPQTISWNNGSELLACDSVETTHVYLEALSTVRPFLDSNYVKQMYIIVNIKQFFLLFVTPQTSHSRFDQFYQMTRKKRDPGLQPC